MIALIHYFVLIYVVVKFYSWFKFYFSLFWGMVIYDSEFKQREIKFKPRIKLNHDIYNHKSKFGWSVPYVRLHINSYVIPIIICRLGRFVLNCWWWGDSASEGGLAIFFLGGGGIMQKRECSYFRSPEVGILLFFFW